MSKCWATLLPMLALVFILAAFRQFEAEERIELSKVPDTSSDIQLAYAWEAHLLDPLSNRVVSTLPVYLDAVAERKQPNTIVWKISDTIWRLMDKYAQYNTSALLSRAQYDVALHRNADLQITLRNASLGSNRVAGFYAISARVALLAGDYTQAQLIATHGLQFASIRGSVPSADEAIEKNLRDLEQLAGALEDGAKGGK